jgi:hypothetical protein
MPVGYDAIVKVHYTVYLWKYLRDTVSLFRRCSPALYQWELPVLAVLETFNVNFFFPSAPGRFLPCR